MRKLFFYGFIAILMASCSPKRDYKTIFHDPYMYSLAVHKLGDVVIHDIFSPPVASRVFAYANIAGYEALAQDTGHLYSLAGKVRGLDSIPAPDRTKAVDFPFASLMALNKVGMQLTFSRDSMQNFIDSLKMLAKKSTMPDDMYENSIAYGEQVADAVIKWSKSDNYDQTRGARFSVTGLEGHWTPTPPGYFDAVEPKWMDIRCISLDSANEVATPPPPPFSTDTASEFYKIAKDVMETGNGLDTTTKWIANFWDCNSYKLHVQGHMMFATKAMTPCGHWMEVAGIVAKQAGADFYKTAYSYTAISIGMFDAFISSWYLKYKYDLIRPETYINTYIDPNWKPYLQTPPFPEYNSAHSTISAASAQILTTLYGENFAFRDSSERPWGWPDRTFKSFDEAAREVSLSRLYGGIHYRNSVLNAYEQGKKIGSLVINKLMPQGEFRAGNQLTEVRGQQ